ncbi:MAG: ROK-family transcriptional regulator [Actinobacteria bacterium HGW-Actinobacteria-4]|nr:MAG: ROK-family transcriptional regulator [Actinobacteria bacterium HGW-Actinobacteria-4]
MNRDTTVRVLRRSNRAAVLRHVVHEGETTRTRVGHECQLSVGSVTNVVNDLISEGLVLEAGSVPSSGGRPTMLLRPRPEGAYFIGVDVGEEGAAAELFDLGLNRVDREFSRTAAGAKDSQAIGHALTAAVGALWDRHADKWTSIAGVGLGLPGVVETDQTGAQTLYAQSLGWPPVAVRELLEVPGGGDVPIYADNGAKTLAAAENAFGSARGAGSAVVALLGRGVGLGVIFDGQILRGRASSAGEWGHARVTIGGRKCSCGGRGCLQAYVGADGILERWHDAGGRPDGHGWRAMSALIDAASAGDAVATTVVDETIEILGVGLGNLVNLYNPERVVIGGWVGLKLMETLAPNVEAATRRVALTRPASQFTLHSCAFGGDSVAVGAALLPLERLIDAPSIRPVNPRSSSSPKTSLHFATPPTPPEPPISKEIS